MLKNKKKKKIQNRMSFIVMPDISGTALVVKYDLCTRILAISIFLLLKFNVAGIHFFTL